MSSNWNQRVVPKLTNTLVGCGYLYLCGILSHDLYEVGHGEVHDVVFPRQLQNHVGVEEVVTLEQARSEAVVRLKIQKDKVTLIQTF